MPKPAYTIRPYKHPKLKFVVRSKEKGRWVRKYFENHASAKTYVEIKTVELMNQGREAVEFPTWLRVMARQAQDQLEPFGKTIMDAVSHYLPHLEAQATKRPVKTVIDELLAIKERDGASARYLKDLRNRLTIFATAHPARHIAEFTGPEIDDWLRNLPHSAVTRNNYKRLLGVLFSYAVSRRYIPSNPALEAEKAKVKPEKPGILTVSQARRLLDSADTEILPAIAIGLFAGLRPEAEIWRLDWAAIDLKEKLIDVTKSKNVASDRFVTVSTNLAAWLRPYSKPSGPCSPTGDKYNYLLQRARGAQTGSAGDSRNGVALIKANDPSEDQFAGEESAASARASPYLASAGIISTQARAWKEDAEKEIRFSVPRIVVSRDLQRELPRARCRGQRLGVPKGESAFRRGEKPHLRQTR